MTDLIIPIIVMLLLVVAEGLVLMRIKNYHIDWHDVMFNLNSGHIMLWLFRGLEVFCYGIVANHFSSGWIASWPPLLMWLFAILVWDFGFYWLHRLHHRLELFWAVHIVHHQGEHFNLSLAVRNSWYSSLTSIPFFLILAILGLPLSVFLTVSILHYSIQFFNHNNLTPRIRWLESFLVMPYYHSIHHVNDPQYVNSNYGGSFIIWDKLFGTFKGALPEHPFRFGIGEQVNSLNPFWASNQPFFHYFKLPWQHQSQQGHYRCSDSMMMIGGIVLFSLVISYVFSYGYGYQQFSIAQWLLFAVLALGSIMLGGIAEGRQWGLTGWLLVAVSLPLLFIGLFGWREWYWQFFMLLLASHALLLFFGWGRAARATIPD